jgi:hypothetical protein
MDQESIAMIERLKVQVKMLTIGLVTLLILNASLFLHFATEPKDNNGWSDMNVDTLKVKNLLLVSKGGELRGMMSVPKNEPMLSLFEPNGDIRFAASVSNGNGVLSLQGKEASNKTVVEGGIMVLGDIKTGQLVLANGNNGGPSFTVSDENNYKAVLGRTYLRSGVEGTTSITSAASLVGASNTQTSRWTLISPNMTQRPKKSSSVRAPTK